ncbi:sensor domain-containing diguanylate cyclase [Salisediminibacterium halotolerans]|uniref:sensor domain-containing diguanylate cyclase n=1 Tax=Salisediminibacterium halotolerans TaxID=517425 RepID=UPI000EB19979|nr:sensor domain-containing diguanylate cyclase [Salisediminibacterium halotolerans]RLJ78236.1 diguanylate cyclase (GGDEF)-like protein [Actinophytocola xinjiangensis]RPE88425.1 diguanylate cyclase (GGDEF)-like protein [Salisediminibacterium halotolerans]TWG37213.1 diguanylate cyclase with GAF sensor [Salisediminibacterium halotolerans]GEL07147.1 hypothetical protein SHA02_05630 [Salisediminibacterium halotolerans]
MIKNRKKYSIYFSWLIVFLPFLVYTLAETAAVWREHDVSMLLFSLLISLVSLFPIQMRQSTLVPFHGVSLAVFLHYGFFSEFLITQLAVLIIMLKTIKTKGDLFRLPLNSLMFGITSASAAAVFYLSGGVTGEVASSAVTAQALPVLLYVFTFYVLNHLILYLIKRLFVGYSRPRFFDDALKWEAISVLFVFPFGVILALLYASVGVTAIVLIGLPLLSAAAVSKTYYSSRTLNDLLKQISEFGQEMNTLGDEDVIVQRFSDTCRELFGCDEMIMYDPANDASGKLHITYIQQFAERPARNECEIDSVSRNVCRAGEPLCFGTKTERDHLGKDIFRTDIQSVLSVPAVRNQQVTGVITLLSVKKNQYSASDLMLLEILANYLTIAVQNVRHLKNIREESTRCGLTNLYNFRYFEQLLLNDFHQADKSYAIILLDLDYFKSVNDSFGHHAGNAVLKQVADVLEDNVGSEGVIARYGGEEFVILIPDCRTDRAAAAAEKLRAELANQLFFVTEDLAAHDGATVRLTASFGIAGNTAEDDHPISVLRNADRAMYLGAKNKGRNKVSTFGA